jgi:hypothetical protein
MLAALCAAGAEFLLVGAHALAAHGVPRATGDMDVWVRPTPENARRVWDALVSFGAPLSDLELGDLHSPDVVFQIGLPPARIDLLTSITGVSFADAWAKRIEIEIEDLKIGCLSREDFIANKRATGRPKDLADIALLEAEQDSKN